ncbi:MAG: ATP-binding protein [Pseudomonadota bacterium]
MIPRTLSHVLLTDATRYPVITVTGPRQSGKTTLVQATFQDHEYVTLEDPDERRIALEDPRGFLGRFRNGVILDEAQRAPELFSYIQGIVDQEDRPGRFVCTGSQNFLLARSVSQSLAGRAAVRHLLPLSFDELRGQETETPFMHLDAARVAPQKDLWETLFTGFYPRIHDKLLPPQDWLGSYHQTYLERDVRDLINVGDLEAFRLFMGLCAGRSGQLLNLSSLGADAGISQPTARRWLSVLEASFLVMRLPSHHRSFKKRLVKSPKLHFLDTGLLCYLLRIRSPEELILHSQRGAVFESFVISELMKRSLHHGQAPELFFWRDATGHEVDLLLDRSGGPIPVEIKSGATIPSDAFRGLDHWRILAGVPESRAVLVYGGDQLHQRRGVEIRPWWAL